ncbi:MAG: hypothetical protein N2C14_20355 [Planctomycetales bacterium]
MSEHESGRDESLPSALLVWDNSARTSLPLGLRIWLGFLVLTILSSVFFAWDRVPPRWVLGGFILSHVVVFFLSVREHFTLRRGVVSITHVVCWSPGWVAVIMDLFARGLGDAYGGWSLVLVLVIAVSFLFDLRDAGTYLQWLAAGKVPREP